MNYNFYILLGQIGATMVSILATLFVGYFLYLKEQRDRIGNEIIKKKREMLEIIEQLNRTPIPGVLQSLYDSRPEDRSKWFSRSDLNYWSFGPWKSRLESAWTPARAEPYKDAGALIEAVSEDLEKLVKGVIPIGSFPEIEEDSEEFRQWAEDFLEYIRPIDFFCSESESPGGHKSSSMSLFLENMWEWEEEVFRRPVFRSEDVSTLFDRVIKLKNSVKDGLDLHRKFQLYKFEKAIPSYKLVIANFIILGFFSILIPLIILLIPPFKNEYIISLICLFFFIFSTPITIIFILSSGKK